MTARKSWDAYFMNLADCVSERSTCARKHVGCVMVRDRSILTVGYNGSLPGAAHCDDVDHDMVNASCVRTTHAEANAIAQAAKHGHSLLGATAYINTYPCWGCFKLLVSSGVHRIVYKDAYRIDPRIDEYSALVGRKVYLEQYAESAP